MDHLAAMTGHHGLFEHADRIRPRVEHGYCTDDNARMLVVAVREPDSGVAARLGNVALAFTLDALVGDGRVRNRMNAFGLWVDGASTDDCWGRCLWGLGVAANQHDDPWVRERALSGFELAASQRSRSPRSMAFAALGAADVLAVDRTHVGARALLQDAAASIGAPGPAPWVWPEARLTYANAALAEAMIAAGAALDDPSILDQGLAMLGWLLDRESKRGHLSVTGVAGAGPRDTGPQFDQQPIEVAAMADACWRAATVTGDPGWGRGVTLASAWFDGHNDSGARMRDDATGGGYDGLLVDGVNLNQGAESTLALISTLQRARALTPALT